MLHQENYHIWWLIICSYYSKEKIVTEDIEYTKERLAFKKAIKIVMNNAANILGLILREEM